MVMISLSRAGFVVMILAFLSFSFEALIRVIRRTQENKSDPTLGFDIVNGDSILFAQYRIRSVHVFCFARQAYQHQHAHHRSCLAGTFDLRTYPLVQLDLDLKIGLRRRDWDICYRKPVWLEVCTKLYIQCDVSMSKQNNSSFPYFDPFREWN